MRIPPPLLRAIPAIAALLAACGDPFALPPANQPTSERIVILYALSGTPLSTPSAFNLVSGIEVRTDRTPDFDIALEFAPDSALGLGTTGDTIAALLPRGALGFAADPGVLIDSTTPWDSLRLAPTDGYTTDKAVRIDSGDVVVASSRAQGCNFGLVRHLYAKIRIDQVDRAQRRIVTLTVTDPNCGYRGLGPGIPVQ